MSTKSSRRRRLLVSLAVWIPLAIVAFAVSKKGSWLPLLPSGLTVAGLVGLIASVMAGGLMLDLATDWWLKRSRKPDSESAMIGRLYQLLTALGIVVLLTYSFGKLASFTSFFTLFGGMLLGWSLQAPVSGFAAFLLVSLKRPFRPGDRVQFPNLGLTGDVHDVGPMYTVLNQVGGSIGSEEAVGRYILVPNAMLFSQVAINYTIKQEAAYILDEVIIRITYDSNWKVAEKLLLEAANTVTKDIVAATNVQPYIRSDLYDYGVYLRLRYMTSVKDRAEIAYEITKRIFMAFQHEHNVDFAIPYVYSYKAGAGRKDDEYQDKELRNVREIAIDRIRYQSRPHVDEHDVQVLMDSIAERGLLQPIVVAKVPGSDDYDILAGHMRFEAVQRLGWKSVPCMVRSGDTEGIA